MNDLGSRPPRPAKTPELAAAEAATLECLRSRDFVGAGEAVARYEAAQPVQRGINVDWANKRHDTDAVALAAIYVDDRPGATEQIREAAAMMYLWGVSTPRRRWLPREAGGDAVASLMVLAAYRVRQEAEWARAERLFGIKRPDR